MRRYIAGHIHLEQVVGVSGVAEANQIASRRAVGEATAEQGVIAVGCLVHLGIRQRDNAGKSLVAANAELIRAEINVQVGEAGNLRRGDLTIAVERSYTICRSPCSELNLGGQIRDQTADLRFSDAASDAGGVAADVARDLAARQCGDEAGVSIKTSAVDAISDRAGVAANVDVIRSRAYLCWCQQAGDLSEGV